MSTATLEPMTSTTKKDERAVVIKAPDMRRLVFRIRGAAPYVQARFPAKAAAMMTLKMMAGTTAKGKKVRPPRDFEDDYQQAMHVSTEGWCGIPIGAFRAGMISACRLVGFKMTLAKLSVFVEADGVDRVDGQPLVRLEGEPEMSVMPVRNATGVADLRSRPMWRQWAARVVVRYDADQFTQTDIANLMQRVGTQVGIGEGRPDSKASAGLGWGVFTLEEA